MKKRGKVLRDTSMGAGLLSIEGQQFPFNLEGAWKSDVAPKVNMVVEVEFGEDNKIYSIHSVAESQLAKEQAEVAMLAVKDKGTQFVSSMVAKFGYDTIFAMTVLVSSWFFFNTVSVQVSSNYNVEFSFWQMLAVVNFPRGVMSGFGAGGDGTGIYGFFAIIALIAPLTPYFWKDSRAYLGGLLPLLFMIFVCVMIYWGISDGMKQTQNAANIFGDPRTGQMVAEIASGMVKEALKAISIGIGGYLSIIVSLYFAAKSAIKFLAAKA